mmetsp:Transcript_22291/g.32446  ORF Transcript_22291/g.32446 Transcript_22291/m.32446 type:complete len:165 (+) Transcript_22291:122-616(+)|eukprot:CAMPEP_0185028640 /NCGR_PEP_ID=MMETSP1103-20130426/14495_1 /TAXON_ID=36769 /ORGANISM="Paraphysomonas bandaiensis, Strain Caron Lab Isolate" /LENGTH=164 /DNA_ID=CAMNT_0027563117 /DNA_START=50 /DNA_END=544 /DNA_ORIENTATION=-
MEQSQFVNQFPPPPAYFKQFKDENSVPEPPKVPAIRPQVYGDSIPRSGTEYNNEYKTDFRDVLKGKIVGFVNAALRFASDANRREPIDLGAAELDNMVTEIYSLLKSYRYHEARENICEEMRRELETMESIRDGLRRTLNSATRAYDGKDTDLNADCALHEAPP